MAKTHHCSAFGDVSVLSLPLTGGQDAAVFFTDGQADVTANDAWDLGNSPRIFL